MNSRPNSMQGRLLKAKEEPKDLAHYNRFPLSGSRFGSAQINESQMVSEETGGSTEAATMQARPQLPFVAAELLCFRVKSEHPQDGKRRNALSSVPFLNVCGFPTIVPHLS
eukprot:6463102-Amphidinium_carterae.1